MVGVGSMRNGVRSWDGQPGQRLGCMRMVRAPGRAGAWAARDVGGQRCDGADRGRPCWSSALEDLRLELHQSMGHGGQGNLSR